MPPFTFRIPRLATYKVPLFLLLLLCFATAILGDSTAEALLLAHFGAEMVPKMYLVNSLFLFLFSAFAMTIIDRVDRGLFFLCLVAGHGVILFLVWISVLLGAAVLFVPLFSYAYVSKILLFLMFWTLANDLVDSRRAGTEFPLIAAGGTLGAITISFLIPSLLRVISAQSLLPVWSVLSFALALFFLPVWKSFGRQFKASSDKEKHATRNLKSLLSDVRLIRREPLLWNMSILYFLLFFILLTQHYAFYTAIKSRYARAEDLASFLGYFTGISMGVTFLLQISLAGFVLKKIGSTRSMFLLPASLCLVFGCLSVLGFSRGAAVLSGSALLFWGIVLGVGLRIAFFDSFFSPNFQVFFSSLPQDIRGRGKLSIEGAVKPLSIACTSMWLMFVAPRLSLGFNMLVLLVLALAMVVQTFRLRAKYAESLTRYLTGFDARKLSQFMDTLELENQDNILAALAKMLETEPYEVKSFVVEILADLNTAESVQVLRDFIPRADSHTRSRIVGALARLTLPDLRPLFSSLLADDDSRVVADAVLALALYGDAEVNEGLSAFLRHPHRRVRANTVVALWPASEDIQRSELLMVLRELLGSDDCIDRAAALYAIGEIAAPDVALPMLEVFYSESAAQIVDDRHVWRQFLAALAKYPGDRSIEIMLSLSERTYAKRRADVAAAIALSLEKGYPAASALQRAASDRDLHRHVLVKAVYIRAPELSQADERTLEAIAEEERRAAWGDWLAYSGLRSEQATSAVDLLMNALREQCIDERVESLVHIAALCDRSGQIRAVAGRLHHENRHVRARAIEVLDNAGNMRLNRAIIELLDTGDTASVVRSAESLAPGALPGAGAVVDRYMACAYPWVRTCARYAQMMRGA